MERPWARLAYHALAEHHKAHLRRCASLPSRKQPWRTLALQAAEACMVLVTLLYMVVLALAQVQPPIAAAQQLRDSLRVPLAVLYTVELGARAALLHWPRPGLAQQQAAAALALADGAPRAVAGGGGPQQAPPAPWAALAQAALGWLPDLVIVAVGWLECTELWPGLAASPLSRLAGLRLARVVPAMGRVPWLRVRPLLLTIAGSLSGLGEVLVLLFLALFSFALVAVQLWRGLLRGVCTVQDPFGRTVMPSSPSTIPPSIYAMDYLSPYGTPCALNASAYPGVPAGAVQAQGDTCSPLHVSFDSAGGGGYTLPASCAAVLTRSAGFDNITSAILTAFAITNTEGWSSVMYNTWHTWGFRPAVFLLFLAHIIVTTYMLVQLALAVIANQYKKAVLWDEAHLGALVEVCQNRSEARAASAAAAGVSSSALTTSDSIYAILYSTSSLVEAHAHKEIASVTEGLGPFSRRRRLSSLVDVEVLAQGLRDVAADARAEAAAAAAAGALGSGRGAAGGGAATAMVLNPIHAARSSAALAAAGPQAPLAASAPAHLPWGGAVPPAIAGLPSEPAALPPAPEAQPAEWRRSLGVRTNSLGTALVVSLVCLLGTESLTMPDRERATLDAVELGFYGAFAVECVLKCVARGPRAYFATASTQLEAACLAVAVLCAALRVKGSVVFLVRLFGLFEAVGWGAAARMVQRLRRALPLAAGAFLLFLIFLVGCAIIGRELFANFYASPVFPTFSTIQSGVLAVFNGIDTENIDALMFSHMDSVGLWASVFFLFIYIVGNMAVLNLLTAILISAVHEEDSEEPQKGAGAADAGAVAGAAAAAPQPNQGPQSPGAAAAAEADGADEGPTSKAAVSFVTDASNTAVSALLVLSSTADPGAAPTRIRILPTTSSVEDPLAEEAEGGGRGGASARGGLAALLSSIQAYFYRAPGVAHGAGARYLSPDGIMASFLSAFRRNMLGGKAATASQRPNSLFCLQDGSPLRRAAGAVAGSPAWGLLCSAFLVLSCLNLVLEEPRRDTCPGAPAPVPPAEYVGVSQFCGSAMTIYLNFSNYAVSLLFFLEMVFSVMDRGLLLHDGSFLTLRAVGGAEAEPGAGAARAATWAERLARYRPDMWGVVDLLVVLVSLATISGSFKRQIRFLRAARALRILKLMYRFPALRVVLEALLHALPYTLVPISLIFTFVIIVAVLGLQMLQGRVQACNADILPTAFTSFAPTTARGNCTGSFPVFDDSCALLPSVALELQCRSGALQSNASVPYQWMSFPQNFDSMGAALITSFELMTGENWPTIARAFMQFTVPLDSPSSYTPSGGTATAVAVFFVLTQLILKHFCKSLLAATLVDEYFKGHERATGLHLLTDSQRLWVANMQKVLSLRSNVELRFVPGEGSWRALDPARRLAYASISHPAFEALALAVVVGNMVSMAWVATGQSAALVETLKRLDTAFTLLFVCEMAFKIFGLGLWQYWASASNFVDGVVSIGSALAQFVPSGGSSGSILNMFLRAVGVVRVVRLARSSRGLRRLIDTMIRALPSVLNVLAMLLLVIFMFSIVGMSLFSGVRYGWLGFMNPSDVNFDSFVTAFVTLYRCSTGENYNGIMQELRVAAPYCTPGLNCAPSNTASVAFFVVYFVTTNFIIAQLVAAVMLEAFDEQEISDSAVGSGSGSGGGTAASASSSSGSGSGSVAGKSGSSSSNAMVPITQSMLEEFRSLWNMEDMDPNGRHFLSKDQLVHLLCRLREPLGLRGSEFERKLPKNLQMPGAPNPPRLDPASGLVGSAPVAGVVGAAGEEATDSAQARHQAVWSASLPMRIQARKILETLPLAPMRRDRKAAARPAQAGVAAAAAGPALLSPPRGTGAAAGAGAPSPPSPANAAARRALKSHTDEYHFHPVLFALVTRANAHSVSDIVTQVMDLEGEHTTEHLPTHLENVISRAMGRWRVRRLKRLGLHVEGLPSRSSSPTEAPGGSRRGGLVPPLPAFGASPGALGAAAGAAASRLQSGRGGRPPSPAAAGAAVTSWRAAPPLPTGLPVGMGAQGLRFMGSAAAPGAGAPAPAPAPPPAPAPAPAPAPPPALPAPASSSPPQQSTAAARVAQCRALLYECRSTRGHSDAATLAASYSLAMALLAQGGQGAGGAAAEAELLLRDALHGFRAAKGSGGGGGGGGSALQVLDAAAALGFALTSGGAPAAAAAALRSRGAPRSGAAAAAEAAAEAAALRARVAEGGRLLAEAAEGYSAALPAGHPTTLGALHNLGVHLHSEGRLAGAEPPLRRALALAQDASARATLDTACALGKLLLDLAQALPGGEAQARAGAGAGAGYVQEAERLLRFACSGLGRALGEGSQAALLARVALAQALELQGKRAEAQTIYKQVEASARALEARAGGGAQ